MSASPNLIPGAYYVLCDPAREMREGPYTPVTSDWASSITWQPWAVKERRRQRETHPRLVPAAPEGT